MNGGTVNHCKNKAQIKATTQDCDYLGGILGFNEDGYIKDCVNEGEIIGNNQTMRKGKIQSLSCQW